MAENQNDDKTRTNFALSKGTMESQFKIIESLGSGGMGEVHVGETDRRN